MRNFNVIHWLNRELNRFSQDNGYRFTAYAYEERDFEKSMGEHVLGEDDLAIVVSALAPQLIYNVEVLPYSVTVLMPDQDGFRETLDFIREFSTEKNLKSIVTSYTEGGKTYKDVAKIQLEHPQIAQNFSYFGSNYSAVAFLGLTITNVEKSVDLIDENTGLYGIDYTDSDNVHHSVLPLQFGLDFKSSTHSETFPGIDVAKSVINNSVVSLSLTIPATDDSLAHDVVYLSTGETAVSRDRTFSFAFSLGGNSFDMDMRLVSMRFETAPDGIPSIVLGFVL